MSKARIPANDLYIGSMTETKARANDAVTAARLAVKSTQEALDYAIRLQKANGVLLIWGTRILVTVNAAERALWEQAIAEMSAALLPPKPAKSKQ